MQRLFSIAISRRREIESEKECSVCLFLHDGLRSRDDADSWSCVKCNVAWLTEIEGLNYIGWGEWVGGGDYNWKLIGSSQLVFSARWGKWEAGLGDRTRRSFDENATTATCATATCVATVGTISSTRLILCLFVDTEIPQGSPARHRRRRRHSDGGLSCPRSNDESLFPVEAMNF